MNSRNPISYSIICGTLSMLLTVPGIAADTTSTNSTNPPGPDTPPVSLRQVFHAYSPLPALRQETAPIVGSLKDNEEADDQWIAYDKLQHLSFSFLSTLSSQYVLTTKLHWQHPYGPLLLSSGAVSALGIGKELYDARSGGLFSVRDLAANGVGILLASGLILL